MTTTLIAALLCSSGPAQAADLEVALTIADPAGDIFQELTLHDVVEGPQTGLVFVGPHGARARMDITLALPAKQREDQTQQVMISATVFDLETDRKGREIATVVSSPRIITTIDQPATISQGSCEDDGQGGTRLVHGVQIEMVYVSQP